MCDFFPVEWNLHSPNSCCCTFIDIYSCWSLLWLLRVTAQGETTNSFPPMLVGRVKLETGLSLFFRKRETQLRKCPSDWAVEKHIDHFWLTIKVRVAVPPMDWLSPRFCNTASSEEQGSKNCYSWPLLQFLPLALGPAWVTALIS